MNGRDVQSCVVHPTSFRDSLIAEGLSLLYIIFIAGAAVLTGLYFLLFPELGALAHDVLKNPWGRWANQPLHLIATPVLTAILGTLASRYLPVDKTYAFFPGRMFLNGRWGLDRCQIFGSRASGGRMQYGLEYHCTPRF